MEKVSVIMPCYNDGEYITDAVASVFGQSYTNIELIVIDDGSDDPKTVSILEELEKQGNVKLLHTERLRPAGARNAGIEIATGKYILPVDADDLIEPCYIERAVQVMEEKENMKII